MKLRSTILALGLAFGVNVFSAESALNNGKSTSDLLASSSAGEVLRPSEYGGVNYQRDKQVVSNVQQELKAKGYEVGSDGQFDSKTKKALRDFQNTAGISQRSGTIDAETLKALKISTEATEEGVYSE